MKNIALIAGGGDLPKKIIEKLELLGESFDVLSILSSSKEGDSDDLGAYPKFRIGEIGGMLEYIKSIGAKKIIFCGSVKRPSFFSLKLDRVGKEWLRCLGVRAFLGDDALIKGIRKILSDKYGLEIISPQTILGTLLTPEGLLTKTKPSDMDMRDIARGLYVLGIISKADIGQSLIVQEGIILGIEAFEGTKRLIERCKDLRISKSGGVLVKNSKINQDMGIDLPTIGKNTIVEMHESGFSGIALGAQKTQIIDFEETIKLADKLGIFVMGV